MAQDHQDYVKALAARLTSDEFDIHIREEVKCFLGYDWQQQHACAERVMIVIKRDPTQHREFSQALYRLASESRAQLSALREAMKMASEQLLGQEGQKQIDAYCAVI